MNRATAEAVEQFRKTVKIETQLEIEAAKLTKKVQHADVEMYDYVRATSDIADAMDEVQSHVAEGRYAESTLRQMLSRACAVGRS